MIRIALCQIDIALGNIQANHEKVIDILNLAAGEGAELVVFPELSLCGYQFDDVETTRKSALEETSPVITSLDDHCRRLGVIAAIGFIENDDGDIYNTVGVFGVSGHFPRYRKVHLPAFGADRFLLKGNMGFSVIDLSFVRLGINICYDQRFPESARSLAILGAQLIVVPTSETMAMQEITDVLIKARAYENRVFYAWANRVGTENGSLYTGLSKIVNPWGEVITQASSDQEDIIFAEIDLAIADQKEMVIELGEVEMDLMKDRMPQYYTAITESRTDDPDTEYR
ncbi:carbon-nitrogen hydrolase family protein [bacterium]|nr:carbon-nitrogen hydrolase family protein [bacterium]